MAIRKRNTEVDEQEQEETATPAKGKAKRSSKADAFDNAQATSGVDFPTGEHEAVISKAVLINNDKGESVQIEYTGTDSESEGKNISQYYNLFDAEENPGKGAGFLKRDLAILGFKDVSYDDLEDTLDEIEKGDVPVLIQVKANGQYLNAYLKETLD